MTLVTPETTTRAREGDSLSLRLKEGTRDVHERVENTASFNRLIVIRLPESHEAPAHRVGALLQRARADYLEVYRRFLIASYGFEAAVDAVLAASPARDAARASGFAAERVEPTALIRADVRTLFGDAALPALASMGGLAPVRTLAEFVGTEYVRRGSRAGGAFIAGIVRHNLGLTRERGASFLMQYGRETRGVIETFKAWADALPLREDGAAEALARAIATFESVQAWHARLEERFAAR